MQQLWRTFGTALPVLVVAVFVAVLAVWALAGWRSRHSPRKHAWVSSALDVGLAASVLPLLYLVFIPIPGLEDRGMISLVPGAEVAPLFGGDGTTPAMSAAWQVLGNLLLFVPMGALVPLRVRWCRSVPRVVVTALLLSLVIEVAQAILPVGRVSATDDVILNTIGALIGALITMRWWRGDVAKVDEAGGRVATAR